MIRRGLLALGILLVFWARLAQAQTSVVIVVPHVATLDYADFEHRLRSELIAEGFLPVSVEVPGEVTPQSLQKHATRLMSPAAISLSVHDQVVSGLVWIRSRDTTADLLRPVPDYPIGDQAPSIFAVRATDVLHGGMLELGYIGTTPEAPVNAPSNAGSAPAPEVKTSNAFPPASARVPPNRTPVSSRETNSSTLERPRTITAWPVTKAKREKPPRTWFFRGMANLELPTLGYPTNLGFNPAIMRRILPHFNLGVAGAIYLPVAGKTRQGHVSVAQTYLGLRVEYLQQLSKPLALFQFVETGAHAVIVSSDTTPPYRAQPAQSFTGYSAFGLGAAWAVNGTVGLMAESALLLPWKRADVVVVKTVVAEAAGPAWLFNAGIQLAF